MVSSGDNVDAAYQEPHGPGRRHYMSRLVSGMWASREMLIGAVEDRQLLMKTTLRELMVYMVFMVVVCYATLSQYSPSHYYFTDALQNLFQAQSDVTNQQQFWNFLQNDVIQAIYWEQWYNSGSTSFKCPDGSQAVAACDLPPSDRNILYQNRVLGLPRIRQLRVHNQSCEPHADFRNAIKTCFAPYAPEYEDKQSYRPAFRKYSSDDAWMHRSADQLSGYSYSGQLSTYAGSGYAQTLHYLANETKAILQELKQGLWITQGTRYVVLDLTVYNANINLFCLVKLHFEFPATGGVITSQDFDVVRLLKYTDPSDYVLLACEIVFCLFIVYYVVEEYLEIKLRRLSYLLNLWSMLDLVVLAISVVQILLNVYNTTAIKPLVQRLLQRPFQYADFNALATSSSLLKAVSAINVFVCWIKCFKYLSFNKTMTQLSGTLSASSKDLSGFSIMFFIVYFGFVQLGYLLFGVQVYDFRTFTQAVYTLFRMILGDFNFRDIERANAFLGPVYFLGYIFFVFFVLLNMFLAIINDTYAEVKAEVKGGQADFHMVDFFRTGLNNLKAHLGLHDRGVDVENAIKLAAADDGFVTYQELRQQLRKARFTDIEIHLFFNQCLSDPNLAQILLDEDEVKSRQLEQDRQRMSGISLATMSGQLKDPCEGDPTPEEDRPVTGKQARRLKSALARRQVQAEDPVREEDFYAVQSRVHQMEAWIAPLAHKMDLTLTRLEAVYRERRLQRSELENIFNGLTSLDPGHPDGPGEA